MSAEPLGMGVPEDTECDVSVPSVGLCFGVNDWVIILRVSAVMVGCCPVWPGTGTEVPVASDLGLITFLDPCPFFVFFSFLEGEGMGETLFAP